MLIVFQVLAIQFQSAENEMTTLTGCGSHETQKHKARPDSATSRICSNNVMSERYTFAA